MATLDGSVCLNHPNTPAVFRCTTCFKPICAVCALEQHGKRFCSDKCAEDFAGSAQRVAQYDQSTRREKSRKLVRRLVTMLAVGAITYVAVRWTLAHPEETQAILRKIRGLIRGKGM